MKKENRNNRRLTRAKRIRAKVCGTDIKPRVSVFRSLTSFYAQVIDDVKGKTLMSVNTVSIKVNNNVDGVKKLGEHLASKLKDVKVDEVVFDRSGYKYHGKVKAFAETLRTGGLKF